MRSASTAASSTARSTPTLVRTVEDASLRAIAWASDAVQILRTIAAGRRSLAHWTSTWRIGHRSPRLERIRRPGGKRPPTSRSHASAPRPWSRWRISNASGPGRSSRMTRSRSSPPSSAPSATTTPSDPRGRRHPRHRRRLAPPTRKRASHDREASRRIDARAHICQRRRAPAVGRGSGVGRQPAPGSRSLARRNARASVHPEGCCRNGHASPPAPGPVAGPGRRTTPGSPPADWPTTCRWSR